MLGEAGWRNVRVQKWDGGFEVGIGAPGLLFVGPEQIQLRRARGEAFRWDAVVDLIDALQRANQEIKDPRYLNVFLLGSLSARLDLGENRWIQAIEKVFKNKNIDENKRFFQLGRGGL